MATNHLEAFKNYYNGGFKQSGESIKCLAKNEKDRNIKISKALTYIHSLGLLLKIEKSMTDSSFIVKALFN